MPRLNFAEPALHAPPTIRLSRATEPPCALSNDEVVRLSTLGLTTLEVAHDLGNLLQVVGSAIRLIDRNLGEATQATLNPIISGALASVERASTLSRRILDTARPRPADGVIYLDTLLNEMRDEIVLAAGPAVQTIVQYGDYIPAIACCRTDLENVILNLVVNAKDAMREGGYLTLLVERDRAQARALQDRPDVLLSVADTGCGMTQAVAAQAFKPFFTTKPRDRGTGLGLAMVGAFAARLGGSADIVSVVGQGTTVILRLPSCGG